MGLAKEIVPYYMAHNGEPDACDFVMEVSVQVATLVKALSRGP